MNSSDQAIEYARDVLSGKIVSCLYIKQACQRFLDDLEVYEYRAEEVNRCLKFMNCLKHYKGGSSGKRFILLPFQVFLIANIVGLYKDGRRKYT
jgi:phage terminase large subunit-like protein